LKKQRVNIRIQIALENLPSELSSSIGNAITNALQPEARFQASNEKVRITSKNGVIFVHISTKDLQSMRAIVNTYIRLLSLSYLSLNL
jgi:tRNA threonylcarbamoyladenosine modification (KEOPS) complex  Pcc1 subunit